MLTLGRMKFDRLVINKAENCVRIIVYNLQLQIISTD